MNVQTNMTPTYTLELTQDEYVAMIAAVFTSSRANLNVVYNNVFPSETIDNMNEEIHRLVNKFLTIYHKEKSVDIIKKIRLDGFTGVLG